MIASPRQLAWLLLLATALLLTACGGPKVLTGAAKRQPPQPAKRPPAGAVVPATQRPYVIKGKTYYPLPTASGYEEAGIASWYGPNFHGRKTANGEVYDMHAKTAAHKTLPIDTHLLVKNLDNGRETVVRVNDRGPFVDGRIIDLSLTAAREIDIEKCGTARVRIAALGEAVTIRQNDKTLERFLPHADFQSGEFYVQIGSFTNPANAARLKDKMLGLGRKTVVQTFDRGDALFYRVQVRGGRELAAARHMAGLLEREGFPGFVVAR